MMIRERQSHNAQRLKVVFFDHTAQLGGGEFTLFDIVRSLDPAHYSPLVLLASDGPLNDLCRAHGIETHILPLAPNVLHTRKDSLTSSGLFRPRIMWNIFTYAFRLGSFLRKYKAHLVHTNSLKADVLGGFGARLAGVPVIWHVHDRIENEYLPRFAVTTFRRLCRFLPNGIIANSQATMDTLKLPSSAKTAVAYSVMKTFELGAAGKSLPEPSNLRIVGLIGRISKWKGQHIFIEAISRIRERFSDVRFQIIGAALFGEQTYETEIKTLANDLGLNDCLEFMGFRDDVPDLMSKMCLCVHASISGEPFGQVVLQAMAAGKPVIATDGGGIPEIVVNGETGLLVRMNDVDAMTEAMIALLNNPDYANALGKAGQERATPIIYTTSASTSASPFNCRTTTSMPLATPKNLASRWVAIFWQTRKHSCSFMHFLLLLLRKMRR